MKYVRQHDIFQFYIAMNYFFFVHVVDAFGYFSYNNWRGLFGKRVTFFKKIIKMSVTCQLKKQIYVLLITEEIVEFDQVGVV